MANVPITLSGQASNEGAGGHTSNTFQAQVGAGNWNSITLNPDVAYELENLIFDHTGAASVGIVKIVYGSLLEPDAAANVAFTGGVDVDYLTFSDAGKRKLVKRGVSFIAIKASAETMVTIRIRPRNDPVEV